MSDTLSKIRAKIKAPSSPLTAIAAKLPYRKQRDEKHLIRKNIEGKSPYVVRSEAVRKHALKNIN